MPKEARANLHLLHAGNTAMGHFIRYILLIVSQTLKHWHKSWWIHAFIYNKFWPPHPDVVEVKTPFVQFWWNCVNCIASVSLSKLTGLAPCVVFRKKKLAEHLLQEVAQKDSWQRPTALWFTTAQPIWSAAFIFLYVTVDRCRERQNMR